METREMDTIEINGTNYMILGVIDKYYYLSIYFLIFILKVFSLLTLYTFLSFLQLEI